MIRAIIENIQMCIYDPHRAWCALCWSGIAGGIIGFWVWIILAGIGWL